MGGLVRAWQQCYVSMIQQHSLHCFEAEIMSFFKNVWLDHFLIKQSSYTANYISRRFLKRAISKIERFTVTLFDLELLLTAPLGNSTTGLIMTGRCRAFQ